MSDVVSRPRRALIVEDDAEVRKLLGLILGREGLVCDEACTTHEGRARLREARESGLPYELLIVDWTLPDAEGLEVLAELDPTDPGRPTVLVVTGHTDAARAQAAVDAGADDVIEKPFSVSALEARLRVARAPSRERSDVPPPADLRVAADTRLTQKLLQHAPDGVAMVDEAGVVRFANETLGAMLGRPEGLVGDALAAHLGPDAAGGDLFDAGPRELRCGDDTVLELVASPLFEVAGDRLRLAALRDISVRRRLEVQLAQADRLSSLGTLAAGVAHEVNNPLGYLSANLEYVAEALRQRAPDLPPGERESLLSAIAEARDGATRVAQIVGDLGRFSREEDALPPEERRPVDLVTVIRKAVRMTSNELRHRGRLVEELARVPPVSGSEGRLLQVFVNLLTNAAQALDESRAAENLVHVHCSAEGPVVRASVEDSGAGIDPAHRPRIFEPFYSTKGVGQGAGLGLSICHGIVTSLGGAIEV
ncbi:MAG: response regulator, partial [Myxococcota bacterium]